MASRLTTLLADLGRIGELDSHQRADLIRNCRWVRQATTEELRDLLPGLRDLPPASDPGTQQSLNAVLGHLGIRLRAIAGPSTERHLWKELRSEVVTLYRHLGPRSEGRHFLLVAMAGSCEEDDLVDFAELIASDPPTQGDSAVLAFAPLFQGPGDAVAFVFPRLLDGLQHLSVAAPILDLANYATRRKLLGCHPGTDRTEQLTGLLGELVRRLGMFEQQVQTGESSPEQLAADQQKVAESLGLSVSLCDALALIGDRSAVGKLFQAMELSHRQVRTEAASALARLGEKAGNEALVAMAAEPVVRLRVLAYAEELGVLQDIAEEHRSPVARAEAELALWLAEPTQFGMPPQQIDLIDSRKQFWPGYDEPVACYLFRYTYRLPMGELSNVGMAGPLVHGFAADFTELPKDDVYAAFAGWDAEHEDIVEFEKESLPTAHQPAADAIWQRLAAEGYDSLQVWRFGAFLGELVWVGTGVRNGSFGSIVADSSQSYWCPRAQGLWPLGAEEAYNIYKGRKLLERFNG